MHLRRANHYKNSAQSQVPLCIFLTRFNRAEDQILSTTSNSAATSHLVGVFAFLHNKFVDRMMHQRHCDGMALNGATNSAFTHSKYGCWQCGAFRVVVSNSSGPTESTNVTLTVPSGGRQQFDSRGAAVTLTRLKFPLICKLAPTLPEPRRGSMAPSSSRIRR